jgi:hypothetical protein
LLFALGLVETVEFVLGTSEKKVRRRFYSRRGIGVHPIKDVGEFFVRETLVQGGIEYICTTHPQKKFLKGLNRASLIIDR